MENSNTQSGKSGDIHICYAIYDSRLEDVFLRFNNLDNARNAAEENQFIVTEVSEILKDGGLLIKKLRVVEGPKEWIPAEAFTPEFDGAYLTFIERKNECGTFSKFPHVLFFNNGKWATSSDKYRVTHWMIIPMPLLALR